MTQPQTETPATAPASPSVFLIGCMGAGKSTVGRQLARRLSRVFYDTDKVIEERTGTNIARIFEIEGEPGFRDREARVIVELAALPMIVLATGGGAVLRADNRQVLADHGLVVYLYATLGQLVERTRYDKTRPLLQTDKPEAVLERLLEERDPLYRDTAHLIVPTAHRTVRQIIDRICTELGIT